MYTGQAIINISTKQLALNYVRLSAHNSYYVSVPYTARHINIIIQLYSP